ncbi:response regulator transcription factor [Planctomonas sp. JC2975]|nr:response regulator transcription factor [Planctomonas sp. JC2975]
MRVLVADDHPVVRAGLVALLGTLEGVEVVGEAADGAGAVRETVLSRPEVVILDLRMPGVDGIEAARRIRRDAPGTAILVLTMFDDDDLVADVLSAGANGYLLKGAEPEEIERAVRTVATGATILAAPVAGAALAGAGLSGSGLSSARRGRRADPFPALTARERQVLDLIAAGRSNGDISDRLGIAGKTVGNHVSAIFLKLGVATRSEAIVLARDGGYGS